ncbi:complex I intermediate-associated protein CIA30 [Pholiota conissans]|uniref:Complex I intermediate-associated protein CIA30 n=1 Tax=Pholiota conissans TaxID=109636 RepID=A0A9P5ZAX6_9AGAR|nr:complex I intermediate-associated protein CIA30 [Pholiota conissans]
MASHWRTYWQRTGQMVGKTLSDIALMKGADPVGKARTVFSFNTQQDVNSVATGCDGDNGGLSTVNFTLDTRPEINKPIGKPATAMFWGDMRLKVKPGMEKVVRGGWAGFRNKNRPTLFGDMMDDASGYNYLALRLRAGGEPQTHSSYFVNIQTSGPVQTDLWQHRLFFRKHNNSWEDVFIPFTSFVRTNAGEMSEYQMEMMTESIKSIGISLLGGNSGVEGKYELGIDSIRFVNEEDMAEALEEEISEEPSFDEKRP